MLAAVLLVAPNTIPLPAVPKIKSPASRITSPADLIVTLVVGVAPLPV